MIPNLKKPQRSRSANRLNKFIRTIFKHNNPKQDPPAAHEQPIIHQHQLSTDTDEDTPPQSSSTFTRLFNSFRGSHTSVNTSRLSKRFTRNKQRNSSSRTSNSTTNTDDSLQTLRVNGTDSSTMSDASSEAKKELVVMDEQPSKFQLPQINMFSNKSPKIGEISTTVKISDKVADYSSSKTSTGYSSANSTSPVSANYESSALSELEQMKLKFYGEIASRLKNLLANNISLRVSFMFLIS